MREKTCCFTGHRTIPEKDKEKIYSALYSAIEDKIQKGVLYFGAGGAIGFDSMAESAVLELKEKYPEIKLILVLPCRDQDKFWNEQDRRFLRDVMARADKVTYTSEFYTGGCMHKRNRALVDGSGHCICYQTEDSGGTAYTVRYAREQRLNVLNIADVIK